MTMGKFNHPNFGSRLVWRALVRSFLGGSVITIDMDLNEIGARAVPGPIRFLDWVFLAMTLFLGALSANGQTAPVTKRPITVADGIAMTRLGDAIYTGGRSSTGRIAHFSPDGKRFVVVLRVGNLEKNANEFSIYLFE